MDRDLFVRLAARLGACAVLVLAAAACRSTAPAESAASSDAPQFVSGAELASRLGLSRRAVDDGGKVALTSPAGDAILLFPETTVASVRGTQFRTSGIVELRGGDAWLSPDDASAIESMWNQSTAMPPPAWTPPGASAHAGPPPSSPSPGPSVVPEPRGYGDQPTAAEARSWSVRRRGAQWHYIVIHHSATDTGSAAQFDAWHKRKGWDGLAYDFVIGNGTGSPDGAVEVGYRWREQKRGAHAGNDLMNVEGIGICLVGDFTKTRPTAAQMRSLARLCNFLSSYCGIPRENFRLHGDVRQTTCPGPLFPRDFLAAQRTPHFAADGTK